MNTKRIDHTAASDALARAVDGAGRQIPPLWPLASHVAVNPYLGQTGLRLAEAAARLQRIGGGAVTMTRDWYLDGIAEGTIGDADLEAALAASPYDAKPASLGALKQAMQEPRQQPVALPTIADLAARSSGTDWQGIALERIGAWAASHFDDGQALWIAVRGKTAWAAYRTFATHDITPEIMGLRGFAAFVADAPDSAMESIAGSIRRLGLEEAALQSYFHQLLLSLGGWAQLARYRLWRAELDGGDSETLTDLLAIRLLWEEALYDQYESAIAPDWANACDAHAVPAAPGEAEVIDEILQEAAERAAQRALATRLCEEGAKGEKAGRPAVQAAFCIDVRSEVFRRALEAVDPSVQTLGFAGFFGVFAEHRRFASDVEERRLPVLLNPTVRSCATGPENQAADMSARFRARALRVFREPARVTLRP